jgi:hypothetical protein
MPMAIIPGNTTGIPNMIILTNGNVGIGISKPSTLLCVNGTSTLNDHVGFNTPPATYGLTVPTINATTSITSPSIIFGATELALLYLGPAQCWPYFIWLSNIIGY